MQRNNRFPNDMNFKFTPLPLPKHFSSETVNEFNAKSINDLKT